MLLDTGLANSASLIKRLAMLHVDLKARGK